MTIHQCIEQLLEIEGKRKEGVYCGESLAFGVARIGQASQQIVSGTLSELLAIDFGAPLHSLVLAAPNLHDVELAMFEYWHWDKAARGKARKEARAARDAQDKLDEAARLEKMRAEEAAAPAAAPRSTVPKAKAPAKASSSAPSTKPAEDSSDDEVVMEPMF